MLACVVADCNQVHLLYMYNSLVSLDSANNLCAIFFKPFCFSACVNCVRWSCGGKYLATGGDDKLIMIWQMARYIKETTDNTKKKKRKKVFVIIANKL